METVGTDVNVEVKHKWRDVAGVFHSLWVHHRCN